MDCKRGPQIPTDVTLVSIISTQMNAELFKQAFTDCAINLTVRFCLEMCFWQDAFLPLTQTR